MSLVEVLPMMEWMAHFMEAQGFCIKALLNQDSMSAIQQEKNGWKSCGERSRHMYVRYFLVKDRIDRGEIGVEYCPAEEMVADLRSKLLQQGGGGCLEHLGKGSGT